MVLMTTIRAATVADASVIAQIHIASWREIYHDLIPQTILANLSKTKRTVQWQKILSEGGEVILIEKNSLPVGFVSIGPARDNEFNSEKCGEIIALYLHPSVWRKGLGTQLCNFALDRLSQSYQEVILWVLKTNLQAKYFYEAMGFQLSDKCKIEHYENALLEEMCYKKILLL